KIADQEVVALLVRDIGDASSDPRGYEIEPSKRRLVVVEDSQRTKELSSRAVHFRQVPGRNFGDSIRGVRLKRGRFRLRGRRDETKHVARTGEKEPTRGAQTTKDLKELLRSNEVHSNVGVFFLIDGIRASCRRSMIGGEVVALVRSKAF